jgi:RNA polymerase sigma-70 factor, ECF subfamily
MNFLKVNTSNYKINNNGGRGLESEDLIERAKQGNMSALNILLKDNYKKLFGFTIKMTTNKDIAEEITQETLLKAVINIKSYKNKSSFSTWLIQISINTYKDYLRKKKLIDPIEDHNYLEIDENVENKILLNMDFQKAIEELREMPYKKRTALILKHYYGYSLEEIAIIMDCPKGTVKSRISKCIEHLQKVMEV